MATPRRRAHKPSVATSARCSSSRRSRALTRATPFWVFEDERKTVLYYLVHLTNDDLGMREMNKAMVKKCSKRRHLAQTGRALSESLAGRAWWVVR